MLVIGLYWSILFLVLPIAGVFYAFYIKMSISQGLIGVIILAGLIFVFAFISLIMHISRMAEINNILQRKNIVFGWEYKTAENNKTKIYSIIIAKDGIFYDGMYYKYKTFEHTLTKVNFDNDKKI